MIDLKKNVVIIIIVIFWTWCTAISASPLGLTDIDTICPFIVPDKGRYKKVPFLTISCKNPTPLTPFTILKFTDPFDVGGGGG